ncbi:hypothetical protein DPMN_020573 [Dreissena polymorpha]|uniref:Uncharacterized protein n=1 Tax=Dreissena polymorpha TaxID=45954 RepID=A0A9D4NLD4_DREPO|nr:hypothetical protein DPMN_020573 [Dreissena polymorpha]
MFWFYDDIIGTNLLTKFHEYQKINVASRVLTRKNAPPPGSHVFQPTGIILKLVQDIIWMNLLTKFHEDRTVNVASRVKKCPAPWQPCFSSKHIIENNLLTKFHEDWTINANVDGAQRTTDKMQSQKLTMSTLCSDLNVRDRQTDGRTDRQTDD